VSAHGPQRRDGSGRRARAKAAGNSPRRPRAAGRGPDTTSRCPWNGSVQPAAGWHWQWQRQRQRQRKHSRGAGDDGHAEALSATTATVTTAGACCGGQWLGQAGRGGDFLAVAPALLLTRAGADLRTRLIRRPRLSPRPPPPLRPTHVCLLLRPQRGTLTHAPHVHSTSLREPWR
jgi:hypothetical protein